MNDSIYPLVRHAANFDGADLPDPVFEITRDLFLDTLGCILSGSRATGIAPLRNLSNFWGGNRHATVFCSDEKTSAPNAAFLNAVMGHANDYDDTHDGAVNHGCVTLVPALLATCEALSSKNNVEDSSIPFRKISGREFIAALAVGLDVSNRLGMAFIPYLHVGWLPTTLWGPFACAAACGRLLKLDVDKMHHAFGLAYSQIHGNRQGLVDGVLSKRIQPGFSASAGIQAAFFACHNLTGARNIVDGAFGLKALYTAGQIDAGYLSERVGTDFETLNVGIKPYPCCRCTHPVIDAALSLKKEYGIQWQEIQEGTIALPPQSMGQIGNPFVARENPTVDAQFSAQYTAALAFVRGWPRLEDFTKENVLSRDEVALLASMFKVHEFEKDQPGLVPIEMRVCLKDGRSVHTRITTPKGSPQNPLDRDELILKFNNCLDNAAKPYDINDRERIVACIDHILELDDMNELIGLLS
ncbi:MAG: MmgE/PrpD family protein [Kiritimatiellales bacterium]|nr:MmgE/PrpD family protein [Kiritimatiellales bacterium]